MFKSPLKSMLKFLCLIVLFTSPLARATCYIDQFDEAYAEKFIAGQVPKLSSDKQAELEQYRNTLPSELSPFAKNALSYWFIQTGYRFSFAHLNNVSKNEIDAYLPNDKELRVLMVLPTLLPKYYMNLFTLHFFHREKNGRKVEGGWQGLYKFTSGRRGSSSNHQGSIYFSPAPTTTFNGRLNGEYLITLIHEMTHALDHAYDLNTGTALSESKNWTRISKRSGKDDAYEDFAESVAYFIARPDAIIQFAPEKYDYISHSFFKGQRFDRAYLSKKYEAILAPLSPAARAAKIEELRQTDYYACDVLGVK